MRGTRYNSLVRNAVNTDHPHANREQNWEIKNNIELEEERQIVAEMGGAGSGRFL